MQRKTWKNGASSGEKCFEREKKYEQQKIIRERIRKVICLIFDLKNWEPPTEMKNFASFSRD